MRSALGSESLFLLSALLAAPSAARPAGESTGIDGPALDVARESFGVARAGGKLRAGGPDWRAVLGPEGMAFTPALGPLIATSQTFALRLESISRGKAACALSAAEPELEGRTVEYERAPWLVERYEVRREGLEQSFELRSLPPGDGDLVVRLALETNLPRPAAAGPDGSLVFAIEALGGVRVGAVTAVDASGASTRGSLRLAGGALELAIPRAFVDAASLPLLIDPVISSVITVSSGASDDDPDVAYDATSDRFLVAWRRVFSATDHEIRGQLVTGTLGITGGLISIQTDNVSFGRLGVASCNATDRFLVAWDADLGEIGTVIFGRSVAAASGALSATATLGTGTDPVLGSEATTADDEVLMAFRAFPSGGVRVSQVTVPASAAPSVLSTTTVTSDPADEALAISRSGGTSGRYLLLWQDVDTGPTGSEGDIEGLVVDRNANLVSTVSSISGSSLANDIAPACDGDGTRWIAAYSSSSTLAGGTADVDARTVALELGALVVGSAVSIDGDSNEGEADASVGYTGEEALIAWTNTPLIPGGTSILYATVDLFTCLGCSDEGLVHAGASDRSPVVGAKYGGSAAPSDRAFVVWDIGSGTSGVHYKGDAGVVLDFGGGCFGGTAFAPCPVDGNSSFVHRLTGAPPAFPAFLVIGFETLDLGCGSCRLVPNPFSGVVVPVGPTSATGTASFATPIPSGPELLGLQFIDQWIVDVSPGACAALGVSMSNAIQITIQNP